MSIHVSMSFRLQRMPPAAADAIAGTVRFDIEKDVLGTDAAGNAVRLADIWPDDAEIDAITHENAIRLFGYDPFAHRPRERSTVAALRADAAAAGVDTAIRAVGRREPQQTKATDLIATATSRR